MANQWETRTVKTADMGFTKKSLREHIGDLEKDGWEFRQAMPTDDGITLIGRKDAKPTEATNAEET